LPGNLSQGGKIIPQRAIGNRQGVETIRFGLGRSDKPIDQVFAPDMTAADPETAIDREYILTPDCGYPCPTPSAQVKASDCRECGLIDKTGALHPTIAP
jgi:hypothetical protein